MATLDEVIRAVSRQPLGDVQIPSNGSAGSASSLGLPILSLPPSLCARSASPLPLREVPFVLADFAAATAIATSAARGGVGMDLTHRQAQALILGLGIAHGVIRYSGRVPTIPFAPSKCAPFKSPTESDRDGWVVIAPAGGLPAGASPSELRTMSACERTMRLLATAPDDTSSAHVSAPDPDLHVGGVEAAFPLIPIVGILAACVTLYLIADNVSTKHYSADVAKAAAATNAAAQAAIARYKLEADSGHKIDPSPVETGAAAAATPQSGAFDRLADAAVTLGVLGVVGAGAIAVGHYFERSKVAA